MAQLPILAPFTASLGADALLTGMILGSYSLVNMVGNLLAGPVIDTYDRRVTIVAGMVTAGVAVVGYAAVSRPMHLLALRIVHGAGGAVLIPAVFTWAGDRSRAHDQGRNTGRSMGHAGAAVAAAAILGPALGGAGAARFGAPVVFVLLGLLLCTTAVLILGGAMRVCGLRELTRAGKNRPEKAPPAGAGTTTSADDGSPPRDLARAYLAIFGMTFAMGTLAYAMPLAVESLGYGTGTTGVLFSLSASATIVYLLLPTNRLPDRIGPHRVIRGGAVTVGAALLVLSAATRPVAMGALMVVYGTGFGAVFPGTATLVVTTADRSRLGRAFGAYYAVFSLGVFVGPVAAGLAATAGMNPYLIAAAVMLVTGILPRSRGGLRR